MKVAVIGGGSTYTPELLHGLALDAARLGLDTVALYDTDPARLAIVGEFVRRMTKKLRPTLKIELASERRDAIEGATFVVVQIRVGGQAARLEDERLGRDHGVIGQETTGIGGLAKALRTIPVVLDIASEVARVAPAATLLDFTNPVSIITEALLTQTKIRAIGLCNIPLSQRMELSRHLGVEPAKVEIDSVGLNHLSFIRGVKVAGVERLPQLLEDLAGSLASGKRPANLPDLDFPPELLLNLGMIPSDYLRYFFMAPETVAEQKEKPKLRAEEVMHIEAELLAHYGDVRHDERPASLEKRGGAFYSKAALEIFRAMHEDSGDRLVVDVQNLGTIPELPDECSIEVPCVVGKNGAVPLPQRPLEPEIRGLIQHVKAYEQLAVRAALSGEKRDLYRAVLTHPLTPSARIAGLLTESLWARASL